MFEAAASGSGCYHRRSLRALLTAAALLALLQACQPEPSAPAEPAPGASVPSATLAAQPAAQAELPQETSGAPLRGMNLAQVASRARHRARLEANGTLRVTDPWYEASYDKQGRLRFSPGRSTASGLSWKTTSVKIGAQELLQGEPARSSLSGQVTYRWPGLRESYTHGEGHSEQAWTLDSLPQERQKLVIEGQVQGARLAGQTEAGLHFAPEGAMGLLVRYTPATVIDAAGRRLTVQPEWDADRGLVSLRVPQSWMAQATAPLVVDPTFSAEVGMDSPIYEASGRARVGVRSDMAEGTAGVLAVWVEDNGGEDPAGTGVYAALLDEDGQPTGAPLPLAVGNHSYSAPSLAWNGSDWMVVWSDDRSGSAVLYGALVDGADQSITALTLDDSSANIGAPDVASANSDWVVVYQATSSGLDVHALPVAGNGTPGTVDVLAVAGDQTRPTISGANGRYAVVWEDGMQIKTQGYRGSQWRGSVATLGNANSPERPDVSCYLNGTDATCVAVWHTTVGGRDLQGSILVAGNNGLIGTPVVVDLITTGEPTLASVSSRMSSTAVTYTDENDDVMIVTLGMGLTVTGPDPVVNDGAEVETRSRVIHGPTAGYLVAWSNDDTQDIGARTLSGDLQTQGTVYAVNEGANKQAQPSVSSAGAGFLTAWVDHRGMTPPEIYATRLAVNADVVSAQDANGLSIATGAANVSDVVVCDDNMTYLVAWVEDDVEVKAALVSTGGSVGVPVSLATVTAPATVSAPDCDFNNAGSFQVAWLEDDGAGTVTVEGRLATGSGVVLTPGAANTLVASGDPADVAIAGISGGSTYLAWAQANGDLKAQRVDNAGAPVMTSIKTLHSTGTPLQGLDAVIAGAQMVVAYGKEDGDGAGDVFVVRVDRNTNLSNPKTPLAVVSGAGDTRDPSIAYLGDSRMAVAWSEEPSGAADIQGYELMLDEGVMAEGLSLTGASFTFAEGDTRQSEVDLSANSNQLSLAVYSDFVSDENARRVRARLARLNRPPVADLSPSAMAVQEGGSLDFDASGSSDPDPDNSLTYAWDFGDGETATGAMVSHTFVDNDADDTYTVTLTVTDNHGAQDTATVDITVNNAAPAITNVTSDPDPSNEGSSVTFTVTASDPGGDDITYTWTFGDGQSETTSNTTVSHTYANALGDQDFSVSVVATDDEDADSAPSALTQTVRNVLPSLTFGLGGTININEGSSVMFNGVATDVSPVDNAALVYDWDFAGVMLNDASPSQTRDFDQDGSFTVSLDVSDDTGATSDTATVVVANVAPTATAGNNVTINEGDTVSFSGSGTDPSPVDQANLAYNWNFGDGTTATDAGPTPNHTYNVQGTYTVTLRVADDDTQSAPDSLTVTVNNVAPVVELGQDKTAAEGQTVSFSAVASDTGNDVLTYNWDFGDGETLNSGGANPTHVYDRPGTFRVEVMVSDGTTTVSDAINVTVSNVAPTVADISANTTMGTEGQQFTFATSATEPVGRGTGSLMFSWDFGDGNTQSGVGLGNVQHTYADDDADDLYTVSVTVDDGEGNGGQTTKTLAVTVANLPPANVNITGPTTANEGVEVSFTGSATDVPADSLTYSWNFGDGTTATGTTVTHTYANQHPGRTVTLTVTDDDGGSTTDTQTVVVNNVAPAITMDTTRTVSQGVPTAFAAQIQDVQADTVNYTWSVSPSGGVNINPTTGSVTGSGTANTTITFNNARGYTVTLTATDSSGAETTATTTVTVGNGVPVVTLSAQDNPIDEGSFAQFSVSATDPSRIQNAYIDYGDGNDQDFPGLNALEYNNTPSHLYTEDGNYTVLFEATDNDNGGTTADVTLNFTVNNVAPTVAINLPGLIRENAAASLSVTVTDPSSVDLAQMVCTWDFGDGATLTNNCATVNHTWAQDGSYTLSVTADDGEDTTTATVTVVVDNQPPTVIVPPPNNVTENNSVTIVATVTDPNPNDSLTYTWTVGPGVVIETDGPSLTYAWPDNGEYPLILDVFDGADTVRNSQTVSVANLPPSVEAGQPRTGQEGSPLSMAGSAADPAGDQDTLTYCWNYNDGTNIECGVELRTPSHTWSEDGVYTVTLTVSDEDGGENNDTVVVTIQNLPPQVNAGANRTTNEGQQITLNGSATDPGGGNDPLEFCWDFGDGSRESCGEGRSSVTHTWAQEGTYVVTLTVTDDENASNEDTLTVTVRNVAPTIDAGENQTINEGQMANLSATATDPGDDDLTYVWEFGDGQTGTGVSVSHLYPQEGNYTVRLTVDDGTTEVTDTLLVRVLNVAPTVAAGNDEEVNESGTVRFGATVTDPGADTLTYTWSFGDGSPVARGVNLTNPSHVYEDDSDCGNDNICEVTLTVSDGTDETTDTLTVTVNNVAPTVNAGNDRRINEGGSVSFNGTATDPAAAKDPLTWTWNFGDGTAPVSGPNLRTPSHTYVDDRPGQEEDTYTVTVTVTDGDGGSTTQTLVVSVDNVAPTVDAGQDIESDEGLQVQFGASATDPGGANDPLTYTWDFGDGTNPAQGVDLTAPTHIYADDGEFLVRLTVRDGDGARVEQTLVVSVDNIAPRIVLGQDSYNVDEGEELTLAALATDPGADDLTFAWDFGDSTDAEGVDLTEVNHTWRDNGVYAATLEVTDGDGGRNTEDIQVRVANVAPSINSTPQTRAFQGQQYSYQIAFSDPGLDDTHTFTLLEGPTGAGNAMMSVSAQGLISWVPNAEQALAPTPFTVRVRVTDNDGGFDEQQWTINLNFTDNDADTLPDDCEQACIGRGLDPSVADDPDADPDGDNLSNLTECLQDTSPCDSNAPLAPIVQSPNNVLLQAYPVDLLISNAVDGDGDQLTYTFEIQSEDGQVVFTRDNVPEGNGQTRLRIMEADFTFMEDGLYLWRARAHDPYVEGAWSELANFRFSAQNNNPGAPSLVSPLAPGAEVATVNVLQPTLVVGNAADPEEDTLTYVFEVYEIGDNDVRSLITRRQGVAEGDQGQTRWVVDTALQENRFYGWRAQAVDFLGLSGPWTELANFQVNVQNTPPEAPVLLLPQEDDVLGLDGVILVAGAAFDADGDRLEYVFTLATQAGFAEESIVAMSPALPIGSGGQVSWTPEGFPWQDNQRYFWRVQAFDPTGGGGLASRSFRYSEANQAPPAPTLQSPSMGETTSNLAPVFMWSNVTDPDGDPLAYRLEIFSVQPGGEPLLMVEADGISPQNGPTTSWQSPVLEENRAFQWRVTAVDPEGATGQSATVDFSINVRQSSPTHPQPLSPLLPEAYALGDAVTLLWKNAYDADGDELFYTVELYRTDGQEELLYDEINLPQADGDTTNLTVPAEILAEPGSYRWTVRVTDGVDVVESLFDGGFQIVYDQPSDQPPEDRQVGRPEAPELASPQRPAPISDCSQVAVDPRHGAPAGGWLLLGLAALGLLVRRRR